MPRYSTSFEVEASPRIAGPRRFEINETSASTITTIHVFPRSTPDPLGTMYPSGLQIDVELDAPSIDQAISDASVWADFIVVCMNLIQPGWTAQPSPTVAYAIGGAPPREIVAFVDAWTPGIRTRDLDEPAFDALFGAVLNLPEEAKWRLVNAAHQLRVALRGSDPANRVPTSYSGLEFLNPLLRGKYAYTGKGKSPGLGGFLEATEGATLEETARRARNDVVHGNKAISQIAADLGTADLPLLRALRDAAITEAGVSAPPWQPEIPSAGYQGRLTVRFGGQLTPNPLGEVAPPGERHPVLRIADWGFKSSSIGPDGKYHVLAEPRILIGTAEGASIVFDTAAAPVIPGAAIALSNPIVGPTPEG
jgi:hypothetical protein